MKLTQQEEDFFKVPSKSQIASSPPTPQELDFFSAASNTAPELKAPPKPISITKDIRHAGDFAAIEGAAGLHSLPSTTAELYRHLAGKLRTLGEEQAAKEGRELTPEDIENTDKFVNFLPDLIQSAGEKFPNLFPSHQKSKEKVEKRVRESNPELPKEPETFIQKGGAGAGKAVPALVFPGSALVKGATLGTSAAVEAADLSEGNKLIGNLTIPAATALIQAIVTRKYIPPAGQAEALYNQGVALGMTEAQLAPLLATEGQISRYGGLSKEVRGTRQAFENTRKAIGDARRKVINDPGNLTPLTTSQENAYLNNLRNLRQEMQSRTNALSPQEKAFSDFLDTVIKDVENNGTNPRQLMGTHASANDSQAIYGRSEASKLKGFINEALESANPKVAKDFQSTNKLYQRYSQILEQINPRQFAAFAGSSNQNSLLSAVFSADPGIASRSVLKTIGAKTMKKISSLILTDPTAQSMYRNFVRAANNGSAASGRAVGIQFKNYVQKNLPEEYKEINWDEVDL